jgi:hypothetical protein
MVSTLLVDKVSTLGEYCIYNTATFGQGYCGPTYSAFQETEEQGVSSILTS